MEELAVCKLHKEFASLQNAAGKFELILFPTNPRLSIQVNSVLFVYRLFTIKWSIGTRLTTLQLSESFRISSSASHTLSVFLQGNHLAETFKRGKGH